MRHEFTVFSRNAPVKCSELPSVDLYEWLDRRTPICRFFKVISAWKFSAFFRVLCGRPTRHQSGENASDNAVHHVHLHRGRGNFSCCPFHIFGYLYRVGQFGVLILLYRLIVLLRLFDAKKFSEFFPPPGGLLIVFEKNRKIAAGEYGKLRIFSVIAFYCCLINFVSMFGMKQNCRLLGIE